MVRLYLCELLCYCIIVCNRIMIVFLTLLLFWMLYEALQIRLLEVFLWSVCLHYFVGQLWYVTPGSRGDRFVMTYILFWFVHDMTLYCTDKLIYIWDFSYVIFRFNSVTDIIAIVGLNPRAFEMLSGDCISLWASVVYVLLSRWCDAPFYAMINIF